MKFSENWLRALVSPAQTAQELADLVTMAGLEVEALEPAAPAFDKVVVAEVVSVEKHPNADRLNVCQVNVGAAEPLQIVCGAPNVAPGLKVPCALIGARLPAAPGESFEIRKAKMRGVESNGMLCSARELGISEEAGGLLVLSPDLAPGADLRACLDLDDHLFTLKLTPNRADCLSLLGVAREVATLTGTPFKRPDCAPVAATLDETVPVRLTAAADCPRYLARVVRGLRADAATPEWMVRRLERAGLRAKHPIVDVTNYVMLELGQPLHAFDLDRINGGIEVRRAAPGETLTLLNGAAADLGPDFLVIADAEKPLALAGVMGGQDSAVAEGRTVNVMLESAYFQPAAIAGRARRLGLSSDAAYRYERGVDFTLPRAAMERATALLLEIAGGAAGPVAEAVAGLPRREPVALRVARVARLLGVAVPAERIADLLTRLGFEVRAQGDEFVVTPPAFRFDVSNEADLIEEIARVVGYDQIPAVAPRARLRMLPQTEATRPVAALRGQLVARGYQEVITYSFVEADWERDFAANTAPVALQNPIASQMGVMRSTLFGGLLNTLSTNLNRQQERVRLFEVGRVFIGQTPDVAQPQRIGGVCYGSAFPEQWGTDKRTVDFFDVKADVEALLGRGDVRFEAAAHPALHPTQTARVLVDGVAVGWLGVLHPQWQQKYDLPGAPVLFELDLTLARQRRVAHAAEIARFPSVRRDLAVVVAEETPAQALLDALRAAGTAVVQEVALFDVYRGKGVEEGKKSLAFRVVMLDTHKTLTDAEVDETMSRLTAALVSGFEAVLRT